MLCLSFTNLIDDEQTDLAYYLFSLKRIKRDIAQLERVFNDPPVEFGKNEWIDMITKEEKSWMNHRKNWKMIEEKIKKHRE